MLLYSASAVPIAGQGALLRFLRNTCPVTKGALQCWDYSGCKPQVACGYAGDYWLVIALVPLFCFDTVSNVKKLQIWKV